MMAVEIDVNKRRVLAIDDHIATSEVNLLRNDDDIIVHEYFITASPTRLLL